MAAPPQLPWDSSYVPAHEAAIASTSGLALPVPGRVEPQGMPMATNSGVRGGGAGAYGSDPLMHPIPTYPVTAQDPIGAMPTLDAQTRDVYQEAPWGFGDPLVPSDGLQPLVEDDLFWIDNFTDTSRWNL